MSYETRTPRACKFIVLATFCTAYMLMIQAVLPTCVFDIALKKNTAFTTTKMKELRQFIHINTLLHT